MSDYEPIVETARRLLGAESYGDIVPRLTAAIEMAALWEETSRRLYAKLAKQDSELEWLRGHHPDWWTIDPEAAQPLGEKIIELVETYADCNAGEAD